MQFSITGCLKEEEEKNETAAQGLKAEACIRAKQFETHKCYSTLYMSHFSLSFVCHCLHLSRLLDSVASGFGPLAV